MTNAFLQAQQLIKAAGRGDVTALQALGRDTALMRRSGEDALFEACEKGQLEAIVWLHSQGVPLDGTYNDPDNAVSIKKYALFIAAQGRHWRLVEWLLDQGITDGERHLRWALHPAVLANEMDMFARILGQHDYIGEFLAKDRMSSSFAAAFGALVMRDDCAGVRLCIAKGVPLKDAFMEALERSATGIARDLLEAGAQFNGIPEARGWLRSRPDTTPADFIKLVSAWIDDADLSDYERDYCWRAINADPAALSDHPLVPAALALARDGCFVTHVAPLVARYGAKLLNVRDEAGCTVGDVALRRGELPAAFAPAHWQGNLQGALACMDALPARLQADLDRPAITAAIRQHQLKVSRPRGLRL